MNLSEIEEQVNLWNLLMQTVNQFDNSWLHLDLTGLATQVEFTDIIHVTQSSRDLIGVEIAREVGKLFEERCVP
jgi:hypothetical protein